MGDEWPIDQVFDDDYLYFYAWIHRDEAADHETAIITERLGLVPGSRVLDLACGHGRIANRLAAAGLEVVGIDATPRFLDLARADAADRGVDVDYRLGDMREIGLADEFDAAICWFTAFGYFDDEQNRQVLAEVHRALGPGGRFLVELMHKDGLLAVFEPESVVDYGTDRMVDRRRYDPSTGRIHCHRTTLRHGVTREFSFFTRLFGADELCGWFRAAGFEEVTAVAHDGSSLTVDDRRMIVVGRKAG